MNDFQARKPIPGTASVSSEEYSESEPSPDNNYYNRLLQSLDRVEDMSELLKLKESEQIEANDDPYFVNLFFVRETTMALRETTKAIGNNYRDFNRTIKDRRIEYEAFLKQYLQELETETAKFAKYIESSEEAALKISQKKIDSTVNTTIKKAAFTKAAHDWIAMSRLGIYALLLVAFGYFTGYIHSGYREYRFGDGTGLSPQDTALWNWANSERGRYLYEFDKWNYGGLTLKGNQRMCEEFVQKQNLNLTVDGRKASKGWCVLWTVSPEKRVYTD